MKYYLFLDESGDHGLSNIDPNFPVFVLCGIITSEESYKSINDEMNSIKKEFWEDKKVIFHSRDIRKCEKEFKILFNLNLKQNFYRRLDELVKNSDYTFISSGIQKNRYIKRYGRLTYDVYEIALSFIIERTVFYLDTYQDKKKKLEIVIEKRGKKENRQLVEHFQKLLSWGTGYVTKDRLKNYISKIVFRSKEENINGLQLADLIAYPIARYIIDPKRSIQKGQILLSKNFPVSSIQKEEDGMV